jgi:hypothetical protein
MAADFAITIYMDDEKLKGLEEAGLAANVTEVQGKKAIQVPCTSKEQKKLTKSFPDLAFDASNACVLPQEAEGMLFNMILDMKTLEVMKIYIMKAYNPLAGKEIRSKAH